MAPQPSFPSTSSPHLILTNPTPEEVTATWTATHPSWGAALDLQGYLSREAFLADKPLADGGRITPWILTDSSVPADERQVLSSCETLRDRAIVKFKDGTVREGWAHGIASVFTYTDRRGHGYANKMMAQLAQTLKKKNDERDGDALFSALYSDIGQKFYAKVGWAPFENTHFELPAKSASPLTSVSLKTIEVNDLAELVKADGHIIRSRFFTPGQPSDKTRVALVPDQETFMRHFYREGFMCDHLFQRRPTSHGALYDGDSARRVWALWTRSFSAGLDNPERNTLHILRLVVEDEAISDEELKEALTAILSTAQNEAKEWQLSKVEMWNPDERVKKLIGQVQELQASFVVRENYSIASLQWHGAEVGDGIEWVLNEKFGWC